MNEVQKHQLDMALEVDRICKKYKLKYSMDGGTLLGAIRHKGFIPWDDDLDLDMLRKDYDKFLEVAQKELGDKYFLQTVETDQGYGQPFAKIRENGTKYIEEMAKDTTAHNGVYIDIFPLDNVPNNELKAKIVFRMIIFFRMQLLLKCKYTIDNSTFSKKVKIAVLKFLNIFASRKFLIKRIDKLSRRYNHKKTDYVAKYGTGYFNKGRIKRYFYDEYEKYPFENTKLSGTKCYDEYLTYFFKDYMTPPPKQKRDNRHGIIEVKLK